MDLASDFNEFIGSLNAHPFREPTRHFKFDADGIADEILNGRRPSSHFAPIPRAKKKKKGKQLQFETGWTQDRIEPNPPVRCASALWTRHARR